MYLSVMYDNILIDGKNVIFRAIMAARSGGFEVHPVTILIRMMDRWRRTFKPDKWHIFWDVKKELLWRSEIYPEYKGGRPSYDEEIVKYIKESQVVSFKLFANMAMTQYVRDKNEADDLIYAFVLSYPDRKNLIVTSDGDAKQIPYHLGHDLYNPGSKNDKLVEKPKYDPVIVKALAGDKSDNIENYRLVRDLTAHKIIDGGLDEFFKEKGRELFDRNIKLVDLSKNPSLDDNIDYIKNMNDNANFDLQKIQKIITKYSVKGLSGEIVTKIKPFKNT